MVDPDTSKEESCIEGLFMLAEIVKSGLVRPQEVAQALCWRERDIVEPLVSARGSAEYAHDSYSEQLSNLCLERLESLC